MEVPKTLLPACRMLSFVIRGKQVIAPTLESKIQYDHCKVVAEIVLDLLNATQQKAQAAEIFIVGRICYSLTQAATE